MSCIEKVCLNCRQKFQASLKEHKRGNAKFCNLKCFGKYKSKTTPKKPPNHTCDNCETSFYRNASSCKMSKSGLLFCSRKCKDVAQRIGGFEAIQPTHYGNGSGSYRNRAFREQPHECADCGYDKHINVLDVHHIDGNRQNNVIGNLVILCPTCHATRHRIP